MHLRLPSLLSALPRRLARSQVANERLWHLFDPSGNCRGHWHRDNSFIGSDCRIPAKRELHCANWPQHRAGLHAAYWRQCTGD